MADDDELALERELKYKQWLQLKTFRDKGIELLLKLDKKRGEEDESLKEVAIAMCAIERVLGDNEPNNINAPESVSEQQPSIVAKSTADQQKKKIDKGKSMKSIWLKWTIESHTFSNIRLSLSEYKAFSGAVKEFLEEEEDEETRQKTGFFILQSLKYSLPAVPKPGEKAKPLTNDQKLQNAMYLRECRAIWRAAKEEMENRVKEYVERRGRKVVDKERNTKEEEYEKKSKEDSEPPRRKSEAEASTTGSDMTGGSLRLRLENACLNELSLRRFRDWVEEDEDKALAKLKEDKKEKEDMVFIPQH